MRKKKFFIPVVMLTLSLLLVYPIRLAFMQQKTENFYFETYTVQPGDTLWSIAREYKQPGQDIRKFIYEIRKVNGISPMIQPGQELKIPIRK